MIKVKGHENLYRDEESGAIINFQAPSKKSVSQNISAMKSDINNLKEELSEIKKLLREIAHNGNS